MNEVSKHKPKLVDELERLTTELANEKKINSELSEKIKNQEHFSFSITEGIGGLWDWHIDTNEIYYSPRWKSMLGYEEHELVNHFDTLKSLVHPDDLAHVLKTVDTFLAGETDCFEIEMRMRQKSGHYSYISSRGIYLKNNFNKPSRLIGTHVDISIRKKAELFEHRNTKILKMIAKNELSTNIYNEIAVMYEERHEGMRCSLVELQGNVLIHGGAPSLPKEYCEAINGIENGANVGSCGTSTYSGERVIVENIELDERWSKIKHLALPHGMKSCWSEPIKDTQGDILGAFAMYFDTPATPNEQQKSDLLSAARLAGIVMERERTQKRILDLAYIDKLTGLSTRTYFILNLEELIKTSKRYQGHFSLLYLDLDNFKAVNDAFGHDAGDFLLKEIADRLNSTRRDIDFIARLSGDEFCLVVKYLDMDCKGENVAMRCLDIISKPLNLLGRKYTPSCSIGIAHYPSNGSTHQALIKAADTALYAAKALGKNRYAFYDKHLSEQAEYRLKVEQCLRDTIDNEQLSLVYQPQINTETNNLVGVEALCRWEHPELGTIPPSEFIVTAEKIGMIKELTEWVIETACEQIVSWNKLGLPVINMAINISPNHFLDNDLVLLFERIMAKTPLAPNTIKLEVTEGFVQTNIDNISIFKNLNDLGIKLAIDDFGKGYSSFSSLKHINVDCMKIDKHFVDDISSDKKSYFLIKSMVEMGHNLGYEVIAEGVETQEQYNIVKKLGCDVVQGYLLSKPMEAKDVTHILNELYH